MKNDYANSMSWVLFSRGSKLLLLLWLSCAVGGAATAALSSTNFSAALTQPMTRTDALNVALVQNPRILKAQKDLEATEGVVVQTRAITIPRLSARGNYLARQPSDVEMFVIPGVGTFGTDQSWLAEIRLTQSLYEGGRMLSAVRSARLQRERAMLDYQTAVADTVLEVETAYDDTLLAAQEIVVREASVELLSSELADTTRRYDAGTVPRFNVLRAEVELANAKPALIRARNRFRIAKNNLSNLLGFNLPKEVLEDIPLTLAGRLEAVPYDMDLPQSVATALEKRTELGALRKSEALRQEDVVNAKAGYKPSVQAFGGYDTHSSSFSTDLTEELHGWIAGVQATWDIFDGQRTKGKIREAAALRDRSQVELDEAGRRVELEVRTAYSTLVEAREVLESQKKVAEEAEEALRLARARNEAGAGTQLDVLSAQTALTDARTTQIQALRDYSVARSRLERATGANVPEQKQTRS